MNLKDTTNALLEGINERISKHGFLFDKRKKYFRREVPGASQIFDLLFTKKKDGIYVEPTVRIKVHDIENIYHKVALKDKEYFDGTKTLGNNLFKIEEYLTKGVQKDSDENKSYLIENENDIHILVDVVSKKFEEVALVYLNNNSSVKSADALLNNNLSDISIHNWLYPLRANLGVIAAKLNRNPDYDKIVRTYETELLEAEESYKEEFKKLKNVLKDI